MVNARFLSSFLFCSFLFLFSLLLALKYGTTELSLDQFVKTLNLLFSGNKNSIENDLYSQIWLNIRLPRVLVAAICGIALASAGVISQGLFRNSLASPGILGTHSAGSAMASFAFLGGFAFEHWLSIPIATFFGSLLGMALILGASLTSHFGNINRLLLVGFALNTLFASLTTLNISLALEDYEISKALTYWLLGGFSSKSWDHVFLGFPIILFGIIMSFLFCRKLDILALGEDVASTLGININKLKIVSILLIALLVGISVALCGAISFVGLMVPHISRILFGSHNQKLLVLSAINGGTLVVIADLLGRTIRSPLELGAGVLIALIGAPFFFILILLDKQSEVKV